jgi:hypothetical protein
VAATHHASGKDSSPSMAIYIDNGNISCYCYTCKWYGSFADTLFERAAGGDDPALLALAKDALVYKVSEELQAINKLTQCVDSWGTVSAKPDKLELGIPKDALQTKFTCYNMSEAAKNYLKLRGISEKTADKYELMYDPVEHRIVFPVFATNGTVLELVGRAISPTNYLRYRVYLNNGAHMLGGLQGLQPHITQVALVEGFFDVLKVAEADIANLAPLCVFTADIYEEQFTIIARHNPFVKLIFDNDKAGIAAQKVATKLCEKSGLLYREIKLPQGVKDIGEMSANAVKKLLES